ncbi:hypothetical protein THAOC_18773 [Thalassiosira oceanica]|uniref:Uncharacterized protein n=1 Tax=Thalassiosira oceanica TaxID=159749 RepID=K0SIH1_THAOC|nr:hypothetical protein THAOC_18773 [Thalassiosira oceanica]|eukprot:EJK60816.1 hypothetical protein THAOC_18773 [Thalassiosira oceanica]
MLPPGTLVDVCSPARGSGGTTATTRHYTTRQRQTDTTTELLAGGPANWGTQEGGGLTLPGDNRLSSSLLKGGAIANMSQPTSSPNRTGQHAQSSSASTGFAAVGVSAGSAPSMLSGSAPSLLGGAKPSLLAAAGRSSSAGAAAGRGVRQPHRAAENLPPRTLARVARDVRDLVRSPPEGVRLVLDEETGMPGSLSEILVSRGMPSGRLRRLGRNRGSGADAVPHEDIPAQARHIGGLSRHASAGSLHNEDIPPERRHVHGRDLRQHAQEGLDAGDVAGARPNRHPVPHDRAVPREQPQRRGREELHGELRRVREARSPPGQRPRAGRVDVVRRRRRRHGDRRRGRRRRGRDEESEERGARRGQGRRRREEDAEQQPELERREPPREAGEDGQPEQHPREGEGRGQEEREEEIPEAAVTKGDIPRMAENASFIIS